MDLARTTGVMEVGKASVHLINVYSEQLYKKKPGEYYAWNRPEMLPFVPASCGRLLDVGCGTGGFGEEVRRCYKSEVWGIEPSREAAAIATPKLDRVIVGVFDEATAVPDGWFDCITFNDVLEHLLDPVAALRLARRKLKPGGCVVASIPNIRHFPTVWRLFMRGEWEYRDQGILDITHLRFFTRRSIPRYFSEAGLDIVSIQGINAYSNSVDDDTPLWPYHRFFKWVSERRFGDMRYLQFAVVARPAAAEARP